MLNIDEHAKNSLRATGALVINQDGDEVLLGLTVSETVFYINYSKTPYSQRSEAETSVYFQIKQKHLLARLARAMAKVREPPRLP